MRAYWSQPLEELYEKDWQAQVVKLAKDLGWLVYHTYNSRRSTHGFPDLVLVRDRVVYLELKREDRKISKITDEQRHWLTKLRDAGAEVYVVRPSQLEALGKVLAGRAQTQRVYPPTMSVALVPLLGELERELGGGETPAQASEL